ncbi:MAG: hypothetical protein FVQ80_01950 [Planctomycetes bacterium]|nr:hypothetical protein [Planctomycetota bacterium]
MKDKSRRHKILFGILLILLSVLFYTIHYAIFRDSHHIFIYMFGDIAFVFVEVLLVTLIIHQILNEHEKRAMLKKLNMVIGAFFSEVGTELITFFCGFDKNAQNLTESLKVDNEWSHQQFDKMAKTIKEQEYIIDARLGSLGELKDFLVGKRVFLLGLLENPNLLEHESFTELLWAVFHLTEELSHRKSFESLPNSDLEHLAGDIKRAHQLLVRQWLTHTEHLKNDYPYLFSLTVRTNPFDPNAAVEVR